MALSTRRSLQCPALQTAISALLDRDLDVEAAIAVREHLLSCAECRRAYQQYSYDGRLLHDFIATMPWLPVVPRAWRGTGVSEAAARSERGAYDQF